MHLSRLFVTEYYSEVKKMFHEYNYKQQMLKIKGETDQLFSQ